MKGREEQRTQYKSLLCSSHDLVLTGTMNLEITLGEFEHREVWELSLPVDKA